jgi:phosphonoacetaldehyde hydrolase
MNTFFRSSYRGPVKAVILDWAGTAVDYGSFAPTEVFVRLFESRGIRITHEEARSGMGLMKKDHLLKILSIPAVASAWHAEHGKDLTEADIENFFKDFVCLQTPVLQEYAEPIPGLLDVIDGLRTRSIMIGSTTGYLRAMMDILAPEAKKNGYEPDCIICPDEVPAGRPYPWMCYQNAMQMGVYPMHAMVKVGDTLVDIEEGLNAGMWTVGLSLTGNLMGMSQDQVKALPEPERKKACERIESQLYEAGAHFVIEGIWDFPKILDEIEARLAQGERP